MRKPLVEPKNQNSHKSDGALLDALLGNLKPSTTNPSQIEEKAEDIFDSVATQQKINVFIDQYVVTEEFMNKVRRYARMEFESMILKVLIWVSGIALGTIVTLLISGVFESR